MPLTKRYGTSCCLFLVACGKCLPREPLAQNYLSYSKQTIISTSIISKQKEQMPPFWLVFLASCNRKISNIHRTSFHHLRGEYVGSHILVVFLVGEFWTLFFRVIRWYHFSFDVISNCIQLQNIFLMDWGNNTEAIKTAHMHLRDWTHACFNNIFEILAESPRPVSVREAYDFLCDIDPNIGGYDAFRKTFRGFKRLFDTMPCFHEVVGKTPKYRGVL